MCVADKLCEELFRLIDKHKKCAKHLMALANELEKMREAMSVGQLVVNTATVVGSATLIGTGIATLLTGGLASPLLVAAAGVTVGAGTVTSFALSLAEKWKSSDTMKKAEKTFDKIQTIENNIKRLQKKLSKECGSQDLEVSSSDVMQFETTARILEAMARRSGRDLPLSRLKRILRNAYIFAQYRNSGLQMSPSLNAPLFKGVSALLITLGYSFIIMKSSARKGISFSIPLLVRGSEDVLKSIFKGAGQVAGGVIGLVLTVPDLIKNCEELIKNKHQTEASKYLKEKAKEIRKAVKKLKKELSDLQETLNQIPEMECHIDLSQEMFGNHIYTRCTICMEYKTTQKQGRRIQKFILLCKKDLKITGQGSTGKCKSDDNKNIRQRYTSSTVTTPSPNLQKKLTIQRKPKTRSCTKLKDFQFGLPKITMSNVHSLPNTMREIEEMIEEVEYFDSNLMFFTDTINLEGYHSNRVDHDASLTQKYRGGGMLMLVNEAWATDVEVINIRITQDYEVMVVSIKPLDHPEGASPLTFIHVYISGPNFKHAAMEIAGFYSDALEMTGGGLVFLLGDFNKCDIAPITNDWEQYVTCPTRYNISLCYGNAQGAYRSECSPLLDQLVHDVINLIPKDKSDKTPCLYEHTHSKTQ